MVLIGIFRPLKNHLFIFLIIWLIGQTCLIYSPLPLQKKLLEGIHLVLSLLAAHGLFVIYQNLKRKSYWQKNIVLKNKFLWISIFIFLFCFSNIIFISRDIKIYQASRHFIPQDLIKTMTWLNKNSPKESNILANPDYWETNNLIPVFALRKVYIGHMCETVYFETKRKELFWFFSNNEYDLEKEKWLKDKNINYILVHENAKNIFQPKEKLYLKNIFENNTVSVYQTL